MQMVDTVQMLLEEALTQFPQEFCDMFMDMAKARLLPPETVEKMKKAWNIPEIIEESGLRHMLD